MGLIINQNSTKEDKTGKSPEITPTETITLTGLYGSGKSTQASAIIENSEDEHVFVGSETADVGMDGGSIPVEGENMAELQNVCMACNTEGEFDQAIENILDTIESADRVVVEGPGNAGTRDLAGTVNDLPELDQKYVGRIINLENWEGEKAELKEQDLRTANFIAVNRSTDQYSAETVERYLDERDIDTEVFETSLENPLTRQELENVEEWSSDILAEAMGPQHLIGINSMLEGEDHQHRDTETGRIKPDANLQDINKALLQLEEESLEDLRIKANIGDYFVNVVNGEMQVEEYEQSVPGYFLASNFGEVPENSKEAFEEIETLTETSISPGASQNLVKENLEYKLRNAEELKPKNEMTGMPDIHSSALKTADEASQIWEEDEEIKHLSEQIAQEYAETAMDLIYRNRDNPMALAELSTELHWTSEKASIETEKGHKIAYRHLAKGLQQMNAEDIAEITSYSDSEDFHEYFSHMLDQGLETGVLSKEEHLQAYSNVMENLDDSELREFYSGSEVSA